MIHKLEYDYDIILNANPVTGIVYLLLYLVT